MKILLKTEYISNIRLNSHGGAEKQFEPVLEGFKRVNQPLWDFENSHTKIELKKQQGLQWFDIGKYYNLSEDEKKIIMMFVIHKSGKIQTIHTITLDNFLNLLCSNKQAQKKGWTHFNIKVCHYQKKNHPAMQAKVCANIKTLVREHPGHFNCLYNHLTK